jgi:hypothetical protein
MLQFCILSLAFKRGCSEAVLTMRGLRCLGINNISPKIGGGNFFDEKLPLIKKKDLKPMVSRVCLLPVICMNYSKEFTNVI